MSTGNILPLTWEQAQPILEQYLQQIQAAVPVGPVKAPYPPRNLLAQGGTLQVVLSWSPPIVNSSVAGYRVYKGDESHLFAAISNPNTTQCTIPVPAGTFVGLYVSCVNSAGQESNKIFVLGKSTGEQVVTSGTTGGTNGTIPVAPVTIPGTGRIVR